MKDKLKQYPLKAPTYILEATEQSAIKNGRSINKEIIQALKNHLRIKCKQCSALLDLDQKCCHNCGIDIK